MRIRTALAVCAAATQLGLGLVVAGAPAASAAATTSGSFSVLTYNVAGLPDFLSGADPAANTTTIGQRVSGYDIVNVQEDFNYHADLYSTDTHPYRTATSGGAAFGSGLNTMSNFPFTDLERIQWNACNGTDCLTPKGFTLKRVRLAEGVYIDLYNLHPNAGSTEADLAARRANISQVSSFIAANSAGNAVVLMGDTNTRYTRSADNIRDLVSTNDLTDAWVSKIRGGTPPAAGSSALVCDDAAVTNDCEVVDKILFRDSRFVNLDLTSFANENAKFRTADNEMLSDHYPITARFGWTLTSGLAMSDQLGGPHGSPFTDVDKVSIAGTMSAVSIGSGARVDQVGLTLGNGTKLVHGGSGGTVRTLALRTGEYVTQVKLTQGQKSGRTRIFSASFTTNLGNTLTGGTATTDAVTYTAPAGWQIAGFTGRSGTEVDKLGVIYARLISG